MENGLQNRLKNATFSAPAQHSLSRRRVLHLGEATCLQLALSSFASAKDKFTLANQKVVLAGCSPFALAKLCFASAKVFFALVNPRPPLSSIFSFAKAKLSLHLGELLHLGEAIPSPRQSYSFVLAKQCF